MIKLTFADPRPMPTALAARSLDNRSQRLGVATRLAAGALRSKLRYGRVLLPGGPHFWFNIDGRRYIYTYIRKNACTAFKNYIIHTADNRNAYPESSEMEFMLETHHVRFVDEIRPDDTTLFVYRDPIRRLVSLYLNKFVGRAGNVELWRAVGQALGVEPGSLCFQDFLQRYVRDWAAARRWRRDALIDPHVKPQVLSLAPLRYDAAINVLTLARDLRPIFSQECIERYFLARVNTTAGAAATDSKAPWRSADALHAAWCETGRMPSVGAFVTPKINKLIREIYAADYVMIGRAQPQAGAA